MQTFQWSVHLVIPNKYSFRMYCVFYIYTPDKEVRDGCSCIISMTGQETTISNGDKKTSFTFDHSYFQDTLSVNSYNYIYIYHIFMQLLSVYFSHHDQSVCIVCTCIELNW